MKRSLVVTALLLIGMASPLFASLPARFVLQIQRPEVKVVDETANKAELTIKTTMLMAGDLTFHLRIPHPVRELPNNDQAITEISRRGLIESQEIEENFAVYLPDNGHFGFFVAYSFEPSSADSDEEGWVKHGIIPVYVTIRDGNIVQRNFLLPDTTYTRAPVEVNRFSEEEPGSRDAEGTSGQTYNIRVRISGRVQYQPAFPSNQLRGIPGVGVWLDWDYDNDPRTSYLPLGHFDGVPVTDMDGRYEFDFSFVSDHPAHHYSPRIRVYANSVNDAAFDGDMGIGAQFPAYAYIDISNETSNINSTTADINGVDPLRGSALRYLYRARRFSIDELSYTPHQIRYYFKLNSGYSSRGWFCIPTPIIPNPIIPVLSFLQTECRGEIIAAPNIVFTEEPNADLAYHEYGHFIEWDKVGVQVYDDNPGGHDFRTETTDDIAWTEGWAEFYSAACHMFWYARELPDLPEPASLSGWGPTSSRRVSYQFLDHSQGILPNTATTDRTKIEGAVACFLHSLWDDVTERAPGYEGDNDDLSLPGSFLLERVQYRWNAIGQPRAASHIESYKEALLSSLDSQKDASVIALYNSLVLRNGSAKPATCDLLSVSGNHDSRTLSWNDNTAPNRLDWNYAGANYMRLDIEENNEQGFKIYRKQADSSWDGTLAGYTHIGTVGPDIVTWTDNANLTGGAYSYVVTSYNASGDALPRAEASIRVEAPPIEGPTTVSFAEVVSVELAPRPVATYTATVPEGATVEWSLAGPDKDRFTLSTAGVLAFTSGPDYEVPTDADHATDPDGNNRYHVTVIATVGSQTATVDVRVEVTNAEDLGEVVLEPTSPRVGQAVTATLTDEDGYIAGSVWTWEHRLVGGTTWTALTGSEDTAESSVYTPTALDLGKELRARVSYRDGHGTNTDMAESAASAAVVGNQAPVITGSAVVSYAENATVDVGRYTASDPDGHSIQWLALAGTDASHFELTGADTDATRTLRFKRAPDFETKNTYSIALKVKDRPNDVPRAEDPNASLTTMLEVQVTVENVEEAGSVSLSGTLPPQVGEQVSAALTDPDGNITGATWQWQRRLPGATMWDDITGAMAAAYSPVAGDVGFELQATVGYTDGHNSGKSAASDVTAVVVGGPGDPRELEPVVGAGQVTLTWQEPSSTGGLPILRYEYQQSDDGGETWPAEGEDTDVDCQAATCSQELALAPGLYAFGVRAVNAVGFSDWVRTDPIRISALMVASQGSNPELAFAEVVSGQTRSLVVETYTASGVADGTTVGWSLAGADVGVFAISGGVLRFATAPDYEMPTDAGHATDEDGNNVYHVTVQAMAGEQMATLEVEVEVTNADDPGMVALSSTQPEVGEPITATLTDQDGSVEHVRWSWLYFSSEDGSRNGEPTVVSSSDELIPSGVLMGLRLQARALYADRLGTHQSAESVQTEPVVGRPSAPQNLTATPSDGALVLAWDAPSLAGYPVFTGYRYRYKATAGTAWQPSAAGALVNQTTRPTLEAGLIHGKEYTVEVWAVNAQGAGPAATTTATPLSPDTPGRVELTSRRPRVGVPITATLVDPDAPVQVRRWRWQQSPWYYRSESDSSLVAPSEERYPELASYEPTVPAIGRRLRAVVDYTDQYGTQSAQSAWTALVLPGRPEAPALSATAGDGQVALTWTAAADQGAALIRYQYHRSDKSGKWLDVPGDGLDGHYTVGGLTNDTDYTFKVRAVNNVGSGSPSNAVTATPQGPADPNPHAPVIAGPEEVSVAEGATGWLADYTTSDDDGDRVTLTLSATGDGLFSLHSSGENSSELRITRVLNYESDDTRYTVTLTATDNGTPPKSETKDVEVEVTNVDEAGRVSLTSSSPRVGDRLTASLSDPDGYQSGGSWQWLQFHGGRDGDDDSWVEDPSVRYTADSYTVQASDVGRRLIARISGYTDGHGSGKTAQSVLTATVQEAAESNPNAPVITGPGSVSIDEGTTGILDTYTTSDADGDDVTLTLSDADEGPFSLNSSGELRVTSALDYESDETRYTVTLTATDNGTPPKSSTKDVTVEEDNVEEEGSVSLSDTSPTVGDHITATLTDPDGGLLYSTTTWSWNDVSRSEESSDDQARATSVTSYRYTVQASDEGRRIRVSASYTDGHGSGKSASTTSGVVQPRPNQAPSTPSGPSPVSVAENTTSVASYTSSDPNGDGLTWSVDNSAFSISGGSLRFRSAPNYESDARRYSVGIWTSDGSLSSGTKTVEVNVTNVEEEGSVSLSDTSPTVGDHITATLTDPDGGLLYSTTTWSWNDVSRSEESSDDQARATSVTSYRYTVQASDEGRRIRVSASYTDGHGSGKSASTTSGVVQPRPNQAPSTPSGSSSVSVAENTTSVASYTSSDPNGDGLTWSVDNSAFSISGGSLRFRSAPNYESDARRYTVGIWTSDGSLSSGTKTVEVEVTNVEEAGTVSLTSSSPRVGDRLTASLSDPDGYRSGGSWSWQTFRRETKDSEDSWAEDESRESDEAWVDDPSERYAASSYTVRSTDVGRRLRARISNYTDGHGSGKSAHSSLTSTVQAAVPGAPPNFTAAPGNIYTRVDLSWSAAVANGSAITDYEYRAQPPGGSWSGWTSVGVSYSTTVSGLTSGQRYSFEVRAVNGRGSGPSSSTSSLVRTPPAKPVSLQALPDILAAVAAPNPFNPTTTLHLQVPMRSSVWLTIYNIAGQVVRTLLDDYELDAGYHTIDWDGRDQQGQPVTSGVYLYQLRAGTQAIVHKLLLLQ